VDLTITLTDAQLEQIAEREAVVLTDRAPSEPVRDLLTVAHAAQLAGVSPKTVHNWLSAKRLRRLGVRGRPLISRVEIVALIAAKPARRARNRGKPEHARARAPEATFSDLARAK